jgi:hypothetical protein
VLGVRTVVFPAARAFEAAAQRHTGGLLTSLFKCDEGGGAGGMSAWNRDNNEQEGSRCTLVLVCVLVVACVRGGRAAHHDVRERNELINGDDESLYWLRWLFPHCLTAPLPHRKILFLYSYSTHSDSPLNV